MPIAESAPSMEVDLIEELRLRRWARENYCDAEARQASWHPLIHDEMRRCDSDGLPEKSPQVLENADATESPTDSTILTDEPADSAPTEIFAEEAIAQTAQSSQAADATWRIVPLPPDLPGLHGPHEINPPHTRIAAPLKPADMHYT